MKFQATLQLKRSLERSPQKTKHYKHEISFFENLKHKLEWINERVNVFKRCYFWYFVSGHQFLRLFEIILWVTLSAFIQLMKSELNWTLFTLFFKILKRSFWLFSKVKKTKITRGLPCFLTEFIVSVEKRGCENVWKVYEKFNQVIF